MDMYQGPGLNPGSFYMQSKNKKYLKHTTFLVRISIVKLNMGCYDEIEEV